MEDTRTPYPPAGAVSIAPRRRVSPAALAGFAAVVLTRALTLPRSLWEMDEVLFARAIERFDPLSHRPHPPGYPLLVGLGKAFNLVFHDPFVSLVAFSFVSSLVGFVALVAAFRRIAGEGSERVAVAGALLFHLSPAMLVQAPLPMSDPPALMFVSLALWAAAVLSQEGSALAAVGLGAAASAAIGCRPQLALAVLPMLAVALWQAPSWRRRGEAFAAFTFVSLLWFIPLVVATGGPRGFLEHEITQMRYVGAHDARTSRRGCSPSRVFKRFVSHPWGRRMLAGPVLLLALAGVARLGWLRRPAALPLGVLSAVQLAVCLRVMDPADAARYALPWVLGVAFAAAAGCEALARLIRRPAAAWVPVAVILAVSVLCALPVLRVRSTSVSPPVRAVNWVKRNLPAKTMILVDEEMAPHASYLLSKFDLSLVDDGLRRAAKRPKAPVYLLAEGESRWKGAMNFRWPSSDAYRRLTRNHYRVVSLSPVSPNYRFQVVRGVYRWEPTIRDARWRWMDADAAIRLFPKGTRAIAVTLGLDASAPLPSNSVTVSMNGAPAAALEIPRGASRRIELPRKACGPCESGLRSARSFVPAGAGPAGARRLAVQLLAVERIAG